MEVKLQVVRQAGTGGSACGYATVQLMSGVMNLPVGESLERIQCQWCQGMNERTALACRTCGAPLDIRNLVSESGWREAPRLRDMTEFSFSSSTCQVEGEIV